MAVTLNAIRAKVGELWDMDLFVNSVCTTAGSTTSLVDALVLKNSYRGALYEGWYALRPDVADQGATVLDTFTRADSTSSIGSAETGGAWSVDQGTAGILTNRAYFPSATNYDRVSLTAAKNGELACTVSGTTLGLTAYAVPLVTFRGVSSTSFLQLTCLDGGVSLDKYVSGTRTTLKRAVCLMWNGTQYRYQVELNETAITVFVDGKPLFSYTLTGGDATTYNAVGATAVGFGLFSLGTPAIAATWDSFAFYPLTAGLISDRERQIYTDTASSGTLVPVVAWSTGGAPAANERYELYSQSPTVIERAINTALGRMRLVDSVSFTPVAQQIQYSLTSLGVDGWLTQPDQLLGVSVRTGTTSGQYGRPREVLEAEITRAQDVLTLNLYRQQFSSSDTLILQATRSYGSFGQLVAGGDSVPLPNTPEAVEWAAWEAICALLDRGVGRWLSPETTPARPPSRAEAEAQRKRCANSFPIPEKRSSIWTGAPWGSSGRTW